MSEIRVEAYPVAGTAGAGHLYLVFVDKDGVESVIRGGPSGGQIRRGSLTLEIDVPMTEITTGENRSIEERASRGSVVVEIDDSRISADELWDQLKGMARQIEDAKLDYDADPWDDDGVNSNSLVAVLLDAIGVDMNNVWPNNPKDIDSDNMGSDEDTYPKYPGAFASNRLKSLLVAYMRENLTIEQVVSLHNKIPSGLFVDVMSQYGDNCFGREVPIDMWPLDPTLKPGPDGIYDQDAVRAKIWKKPIELIRVGDIVVSFDANDNLVPGPVTRTMTNEVKILLNFHGTRVTPGHVYFRPDSKKAYKFETLIDVLREDGIIQTRDGVHIRAATNVPVSDPRDGFVRAVTGKRNADGTVDQKDAGRIRLGTRFLIGAGKERKSYAIADLIEAGGGVVGDDELIRVGDGPRMAFHWDFGDMLPKPEDFVLACSGTTLEDIYKAAEWESHGPRLQAPMVLDRGPVQPLKGAALWAMPRNEPLDVARPSTASTKPQGTLNRKLRKAMEAKQRQAAQARKRIAG